MKGSLPSDKSSAMYTLLIICIIFVKYTQCCECDVKKAKDTSIPPFLKPTVDKRQIIHDTEYDSSEFIEVPSEFVEDSQKIKNSTELNTTTDKILLSCPHYKPGQDLNIEKMVDVWRLAFFRSAAELGCFKILLKNLRNETKEYFAEKYGDFNKTVNWDDCVLHLTNGRASPALEQTHLLQRVGNYSGLMSNIIITEDYSKKENVTMISLQDNSPDQWMVVNNLLLMRDCDNGDVVVFSRVPFDPSQSEITEALDKFGEEVKEGVWACRGQNQAILNNPRYQILS